MNRQAYFQIDKCAFELVWESNEHIFDKNNVINNNIGISIMSMKNKVCEGCEILGINDPVINMASETNHMKNWIL